MAFKKRAAWPPVPSQPGLGAITGARVLASSAATTRAGTRPPRLRRNYARTSPDHPRLRQEEDRRRPVRAQRPAHRRADDPGIRRAAGLADLLEAATASATRRAYDVDFRHFAAWAAAHGLAALPAAPHTVALYVTAQQDLLRSSSLLRRLAAIAARHRGAGHDSPADHELVRRAVAGLRRARGTASRPRPRWSPPSSR